LVLTNQLSIEAKKREFSDSNGGKQMNRRNALKHIGAVGLLASSGMGLSLINRTASAQVDLNLRDSFSPDPAVYLSPPDPVHIIRRARGWKVLPNGDDDHDNLEWALRNTEPGGEVRLVSGVYMNIQQQNRKMTGVSRAAFTGILAAGLVMHTLTANAADSYQEKVLFEPHQSQRLAEARGRIMIYDGLDSTVVDKAMDEQFDRIDNMMFIRTHHSSEEGEDYVDDDGC
jgi:hypothetical protein